MDANIFKITMYKLGIFRSLNGFKGKGHVNVPFIKVGTQDPSALEGNQKWRPRWSRNESHVQPLEWFPKLTLTKDKVYTINKKGENNVFFFLALLFEWLLPHYSLKNAST